MPRVLNQRIDGMPRNGVYVGRPSRWGSPFVIGRDGDRAEVIRKYEEYLRSRQDLMAQLQELRGKDLVCWCAPLPCHADVLLRLANEGDAMGDSTMTHAGGNTGEDQTQKHEALRTAALSCTACPLATTRQQVVFSRGDPQARLWIVGEGPGADEDSQGAPFIGRAGQLLDKILEAAGIAQDEIFITNTVLCRPPGNRVPTNDEITTCAIHRDALLDLWRPPLVVLLGATAARTFLGGNKLADLRGQKIERDGRVYFATFHPAFLLRDPRQKPLAWKDWQTIRDELRVLSGGDTPPGGAPVEEHDHAAGYNHSVVERLMPYIEQTVGTPKGTGRLVQVFHDRCGVVLDHNPAKVAYFSPGDVTELVQERQAG